MRKQIFLAGWLTVFAFAQLQAQTDVLTQHNDLGRTGWNNQETILDTNAVNQYNFGKIFSRTVDDRIYAQPLVATGISTGSGTRNLVFVATGNNSVYAFDADDSTSAAASPVWQVNLMPSGARPPLPTDVHPSLCGGAYYDFKGNYGIVGTPVINKSTNTMYLVFRYVIGPVDNHPYSNDETSYTSTGFNAYICALDIRTGAVLDSVRITAQTAGTGDGSVGGIISFDPRRQFNRGGLVLSNGIVYIPFAAHCDWNPCHGWILGYDATTLTQKVVWASTPKDGRGGIWMSGTAPAVDASGNLFFATGNGYMAAPSGSTYPAADTANRGESVVKLAPNPGAGTAKAASFFTPYNYKSLDDNDLDFGIQVMLIPSSNLAFTGLKTGDLFFMDQTNLGGYSSSTNNVLSTTNIGTTANMHSNFAYFKNETTEYIYQASEQVNIMQFPLIRPSTLGTPITNAVNNPTGQTGGFLSVSSNGNASSSGVVWLYQAQPGCSANNNDCQGLLRALKATDISRELWNSNINPSDATGLFTKMSAATVANGKVYIPTLGGKLLVYGLRANSTCFQGTNLALNKTATASTLENGTYPASNAVDGNLTTRWSSGFNDTNWIYVDLSQVYDICGVIIYWENAYAKTYKIETSNDASNWTVIDSLTNADGLTDPVNIVNLSGTGRYIRMHGVKRYTAYGYSMFEFQVYGTLHNNCTAPTLLSPTNLGQNNLTLNWQAVSGATKYVVQYKATTVDYWTYDTVAGTSLNLSALTCNQAYSYGVQALCAGSSSPYSSSGFTTAACTNPCSLETRYSHADIGVVGIAGTACETQDPVNGKTFTVTGTGTGFPASGLDAFQMVWINQAGDNYYLGRIASQDATNPPNNLVGLMIRDSITPTARFAYIARAGGNGNQFNFMYRATPAGPITTITTTVSSPSIPYWVKISKTGTTYTGYISSTGFAPWIQVGTTVDLGFGVANAVDAGVAMTSATNSLSSQVVLDNYSSSSVLPIRLERFTANNVNNQYVQVDWTTEMEQNNDYFEVERSIDAKGFVSIGKVKGAGTTEIPQNYGLQDHNPANGNNFYRLKQVDLDGQYWYSPVVRVIFGKNGSPILYPNPSTTYVYVESGGDPIRSISLVDVAGRVLLRQDNPQGGATVPLMTTALKPGIYLVRVQTDRKSFTLKLIQQ